MKSLATLIATVGFATLLAGSLNIGTARADVRLCQNFEIVIELSQLDDWDTTCAGAIDAISFLEVHGFKLGGPINIHTMGRITEKDIAHALGYFDSQDGRVYVLNSSAARRTVQGVGIFDVPMDEDLYRSIVTHEVAHLIASRNFKMESPPRIAQEYIAYVTQLATMPRSLRHLVLANFPGEGFRISTEISSIAYMFSPEKFAVGVYRHFVRTKNGAAYFRRLLAGEIQLDVSWVR